MSEGMGYLGEDVNVVTLKEIELISVGCLVVEEDHSTAQYLPTQQPLKLIHNTQSQTHTQTNIQQHNNKDTSLDDKDEQ
jgi:hypothetical protein